MVISEGRVEMDPAKVRAVAEWPTPKNLRELRGFIGFANFYRRFIKDFSKICHPLHNLTKKDTPWKWDSEQIHAFKELRSRFVASPVLAQWDPSRPTRVEVDSSGFASGGEILQKQDDGHWHPIAYRSESMDPAERNYQIWDRKMLAIIRALKDWRHFLEGLPQPFEIYSDHANLVWWTKVQDLSRRQVRWAIWLSRFDFKLVVWPGVTMGKADALSRCGDHEVKDGEDNQSQVVLHPDHFLRQAAEPLERLAAVARHRFNTQWLGSTYIETLRCLNGAES
jgi:hypothetical protein